jgi:hypothetical protein
MRCIENHPHRNSLVNGAAVVSSSTRTLQLKIEALKRELALRDAMCGYAMYTNPSAPSPRPDLPPQLERQPILDTLTKQQLAACQRMTCRFAISGAEKEIDVRSLAEVRAMANMLRSALWSACGGDQSTVLQTLKDMASRGGEGFADLPDQDNSGVTKRERPDRMAEVEEEEEQAPDERNGGDTHREGAEEGVQEEEERGEAVGPVVISEPRKTPFEQQTQPPAPDEGDGEDEGESGSDPFALFKQTEGQALHETYEAIKQQLKDAKNRQKALVKQVNQTKIEIDAITSQFQSAQSTPGPDSPSSNGFSPPRPADEASRQSLTELKGSYKQARSELISCKEEIVNLNRKKQVALNALVSAYEAFVSAARVQGGGVDRGILEGMVAEDVLFRRQQQRGGGARSEEEPS